MKDIDEGAQWDGDSDEAEFEEWCRLNYMEEGHPDARLMFREAKAEDDDPYGSRGLMRSDFH